MKTSTFGVGKKPQNTMTIAVLDDLDHFIKEHLKIKHYIRYMDDFILIHEDKEYLKLCKMKIAEKIEQLGLMLSKKKTQIFPVAQRISFLGFSFRLTDTGKVVMKMLLQMEWAKQKNLLPSIFEEVLLL